jgi:two-component system chemotaxis response regulator CheY
MAKILVVDDYAVTQRVITFILQRSNHTILTAANGKEALDLLGTTAIDLAIIDMAMPIMDGLTLLRHMRADETYRAIPVIMLTASGDDEHRVEATAEGVDAFLTKPASTQELTIVVNRLLAEKG